MSLIDLGEVRAVIATSRPSRWRWRRPVIRARQPWWVRVGVPLVVAMLLAASAADDPGGIGVRVPIAAAANMYVSGATVLVADYRRGVSRLAAYDLSSGVRKWSAPLDLFAGATRFAVIGGVVIAASNSVSPNATETEAFDLATGAVRWKSPFSLGRTIGRAVVLTSTDPDDGETFYRADLATGSLLWSTAIGGECSYAYAADGIAVGCEVDGEPGAIRMRVLDVRTGATRAERVQPKAVNVVRTADSTFTQLPEIDVIGSLVVVTDLSASPPTVIAYRAADLSKLWTGVQQEYDAGRSACAPAVCAVVPTGQAVIDPVTGRTILDEGAPGIEPLSAYLLVPVGPRTATAQSFPVAVLSAGTTFPTPSTSIPAAPVWLRQRGGDRPLLQSLPGAGPGRCVQVTDYLACATSAGQMTFWKLPS